MTLPPYFLVFDVESVGLHGEGFAVGWIVIDADGRRIASAEYSCDPALAAGDDEGRAWISDNVPPLWRNCDTPRRVRDAFWDAVVHTKERGGLLAADVPWPVEARFLIACVEDNADERRWQGPYPLIDIASVRLAAGFDPLGTEERRPNELPAHNPAADARQSARLLVEALDVMRQGGAR